MGSLMSSETKTPIFRIQEEHPQDARNSQSFIAEKDSRRVLANPVNDVAIRISNLFKCYHIYDHPRDRLRQFILPKLQRSMGMAPNQYYREFWALSDVSFEVKKGETVGIIGRNGSGKSTLLQMICGTLTPTSGDLETCGRIAALLELGSGFNFEFTGRENVYLNATLLGLSQHEIDHRLEDIVAFADIGEFIDQPVKTYSSGMFVRLAFAVVAHVDADILVIDEALAVGDAFFTQKCMRFLRRFRENGTLIFVSHDVGAVTGLCDTAIWLNKGKLEAFGSAKLVSERYMASVYADNNAYSFPDKTIPEHKQREASVTVTRDVRADVIDRSSLRNDLQVLKLTPGISADFGVRGAEITSVLVLDSERRPVSHVIGGELIILRIEVMAIQDLKCPIVGFLVKDRLGQALFGDNTFIRYRNDPAQVYAGNMFGAEFTFAMPILPCGDYSIAAAIATGTQEEHVQHHWVHDALIVKSLSSSVSTGLVGIPMQNIKLFVEEKFG